MPVKSDPDAALPLVSSPTVTGSSGCTETRDTVITAPAGSPFGDVATDNQFYREISWLAESGISTGWDDGTFRPVQPVARDAMAAFMLRFANLTAARLDAPGTLHLD